MSSKSVRRGLAVVVVGLAVTVTVAALAATAGPAAANSVGPAIRIASVDAAGVEGSVGSLYESTSVSADGRHVAFVSGAANLVPGDLNPWWDAFVKDRVTGQVERVSVSSAGAESNGHTYRVSISANGRYVAFASDASNLVPGDVRGWRDVFVRDRTNGTTLRVSTSVAGAEGNGPSDEPSISANGVYVAFSSRASNLVPADLGGYADVFVRAVAGNAIERVSLNGVNASANGGSFDPVISANGKHVAFVSAASDLVGGDVNGDTDVFVRDRSSAITERVSVSTFGVEGNDDSHSPAISSDGRYVAFTSEASTLVFGDTNGDDDVFYRDRRNNMTRRASVNGLGVEGNGHSDEPSITANGRLIAFASEAANMGSPSTVRAQIYLRDIVAGTTERITVARDGQPGDHESWAPTISADGMIVVFGSNAFNLAPNVARPQAYVRGTGLAPDPNCDFGESSIVCELDYDAVGPLAIAWSVDGVHVPGLDDEEVVTHPCTPGVDVRITVRVTDANGPVEAEVTLPCLTDES